MADKPLSREELMSGELNRSRRAAKLLASIEARCLYMRDESRRVVAAYLLEGDGDFDRRFDADYLQSVKLAAASDETLLLEHLERFASQWKPLVPADPDLRARLVRLIWEKYGVGPATLAALGGAEPEVGAAYRQLFGDALEDLSGGPGTAPVPPGAAPQAWQDVETRLEWLNLVSGEILYRPGDPGDGLYVIISGRLRTTVEGQDGGGRLVGEMGRGELLGELEVLSGEARGAQVRAVRDSELVRLGRDDLLALAQRHMQVMLQINKLIARRLRQQYVSAGRVDSTLLTFALLPCDSGVPLPEVGRQLAQALGAFGPTVYVTCAIVDEAVEPGAAQAALDDPRNAQIVSWLSELEARYRYVVYEGEPEASEWSRRCVRQADRILLLGHAGAQTEPAAHEIVLLAGEASAARTELVLLHAAHATAASGTAQWLKARSVRDHYHVRLGNAQDLAHVARRLTSHALGLVLGGGGARGFAHIGVYRALQEAGIEVDLVGGTSMGAIISGAIGLGWSAQQMKEMARQLSSPIKLFDPTLPLVSLFASGKATRNFRNLYGDALIEDLWRPVFCVATNVTRATETVFRQGPLWKAVRASGSLPGVFPPVLHEGDLLVDGGAMNNIPVDVMRELVQGGRILAVNVSPPVDLVKEYHFGPVISGSRALISKINPRDSFSVPSIYECLQRMMSLHDFHGTGAKPQLADAFLSPSVDQYGLLEFGAYDSIIEAGYRAAKELLERDKEEGGGLAAPLPEELGVPA
jgi:NTE family protein